MYTVPTNSQFEDVQVITDGIDGLLGIPGFVKDNNTGLPITEKLANTFTSTFTEGYTKPGVSVDLSDCNTIGDVMIKQCNKFRVCDFHRKWQVYHPSRRFYGRIYCRL